MPDAGTNVFVSYSRADASLIAPIVKLLRANQAFVFQDIDDIRPGKKWRTEIARGLAASQLVVVFWCDHASESEQVSKEWRAALDQEKDLLPLLLDTTPLPPELSEYQWIDFGETVGPNHGSSAVSETRVAETAPRRTQSWGLSHVLTLAGAAALLVAVVAGGMFTLGQGPAPVVAPSQPTPPAPSAPGGPGISELVPWLAGLLVMGLGVAWLFRRVGRRRISVQGPRPPREYERQIAVEIEAEIARRTALREDRRST